MKLSNGLMSGVISCGLVLTAGGAQAAARPPQLSLRQVIDKVTSQVRRDFPEAKLMEAAGTAPNGRTRDPRKVTDWRLVFDIFDQSSAVRSVEVPASLDGHVGAQVRHPSLWMGVTVIDGPIGMTPAEAYERLGDAGHHEPFQYVSLVEPLIPNSHLQYQFFNTASKCDGYAVDTDDDAVSNLCD